MKLTNEYLGILWETKPDLKKFYLEQQSNEATFKKLNAGLPSFLLAFQFMDRKAMAKDMCVATPKRNIFYITKRVQDNANLIKIDKIDLDWFKQLKSDNGIYIINKDEFLKYRIYEGSRINIVHFYREHITIIDKRFVQTKYDSYAIDLEDKEYKHLPGQKIENIHKFVKLLLFIELAEITYEIVLPNRKLKVDLGDKADKGFFNGVGIDVTVVNTTWNKAVIVAGEFSVRGHLRVQPWGEGRKNYKLIWIDDYVKKGYVRNASKEKNHD